MPEKPERKKNNRPASGNVDPRALIARLSQEGRQLLEQEIIAPLLPDSRVRTRVNGLVYEFKPQERFTGWGRFRPLNEREVTVLGEALPWQRGAYLELFPVLRVILLWPASGEHAPGTWLALPFNESDAHQRFGFDAGPLPVFLCDPTGGAERFERVIARADGRALWFEGPDLLADPTQAEWLREAATSAGTDEEHFLPGLAASQRLALLSWRIHRLEQARSAKTSSTEQTTRRYRSPRRTAHQNIQGQHARLRSLRLEEQLRAALTKADATLRSFSEIPAPDGSPGQLIVEWSEHGQVYTYRSAIDANLNVVSSGICLSGRDRDFDLTSLVSVMTDSPDWSH